MSSLRSRTASSLRSRTASPLRPRTTTSPRSRTASLAVALLLLACNGDAPPPRTDPPPSELPTPAEATPPAANGKAPTPSEPSDSHARLLAWLDPDAVSVAYLRTSAPLHAETLAVIYALPPRAEELLDAAHDVDMALESLRKDDTPTEAWLGSATLVTAGRFSQRPTVLRPLLRPRDEVASTLLAMGLRRQDVEPFEVYEPQRTFPYRVALLDGDVAAFVSVREPGSGMPPLAAARDMPPSEVETQLDALLSAPGGPALALFVAGPMLHFDLDQSVLAARFELLQTADGALDGQVALQLDGDPAPAVQSLRDRTAPEQSDRVQELMRRTAFATEAGVVTGRLQLTPTDAALLLEPR